MEPPIKEAEFEVSTQFPTVTIAVMLLFSPTATAPTATAPPPTDAEFNVIVQSITVTVESPAAATAPPSTAELEVIVQSVTVTRETVTAATAPPAIEAKFEIIVQFAAATVERSAE
jgi:hypothetical protein